MTHLFMNGLRRGINLGGWLSQSRRRGEDRRGFYRAADASALRTAGFDHVRLPVDEAQLWTEDGGRETEAWELLRRGLDDSLAAGLKVMVDLHILRSHYFMAEEKPLFTDSAAPERFADCWREIAEALGGYPSDRVAFELMNEPVAARAEDWNRVYPYPYRAIRERDPERLVMIGSNKWNQAVTFPELAVPDDDPHLLLTFHYYNPMPITHYRAGWVAACAAYEGPIQFPGRPIPEAELAKVPEPHRTTLASWNEPFGPDAIRCHLAPVLEVRERTGLPVHCGEFGAIHQAPPDLVRTWHETVIGEFEEAGIPWTAWSWKGRFGMTDADGRPLPWASALLSA